MADSTVTLREIARHSGVSIGTVSRVLNQRPDVNAAIRQRVLDAVAVLNYAGPAGQGGPAVGSRPLKQVTFLLALTAAVDSATSVGAFWADILHGVEQVARPAGCQVHFRGVAPTEDDPALLDALLKLRSGGVLLVGAVAPSLISALRARSVPLVLVDHRLPGEALDAVLADDFGGMTLAVQHLLAHGHRQIAFLGGTPDEQSNIAPFFTVEQRLAAYQHTLLAAGITVDPNLYVPCQPNVAGGDEACQRLLARGAAFSAICCANDKTAIGAMKALHAVGRRIPDDVSLVGFDDGEMAAHSIPALTTVHVDAIALGATAWRVLAARASQTMPIPVTTTLSVTLTERASVRDLTT